MRAHIKEKAEICGISMILLKESPITCSHWSDIAKTKLKFLFSGCCIETLIYQIFYIKSRFHSERLGSQEGEWRDFPGSPVVRTLPSNGQGEGSIPGGGAKILYASQPKNQNIKQK